MWFDISVVVLNVVQLILEGMGRSLHTNLNARFKCDTLKVLVSANSWFIDAHNYKLVIPLAKYQYKVTLL